jgi:predicted RNA-binding Zn-ribbon protein involved in translation (DUF1610 family)
MNALSAFSDEGDSPMSELIEASCSACDTVLVVRARLRGTKLICPKCQNASVISGAAPNNVSTPTFKVDNYATRAKLVASIANYGRRSRRAVGFHCPFCQSNLKPKIKPSLWFPIRVIGLFKKHKHRFCRSCGMKLD